MIQTSTFRYKKLKQIDLLFVFFVIQRLEGFVRIVHAFKGEGSRVVRCADRNSLERKWAFFLYKLNLNFDDFFFFLALQRIKTKFLNGSHVVKNGVLALALDQTDGYIIVVQTLGLDLNTLSTLSRTIGMLNRSTN